MDIIWIQIYKIRYDHFNYTDLDKKIQAILFDKTQYIKIINI